ncbi:MAG: TolC family protein [Acidobacteriota bacterium]|nr:MAG: TolC family protein [Acidobacteriota bacterium]
MSLKNARHILRPKTLAGIASVLLAAAIPAFSQGRPGTRVDLETAVNTALSNDPQTKLSESETRTAEARIEEAESGRMPTVNFGQSFTRSNNPVFVFGSLLEQGRFTEANFALNPLNHPDGLNNFRTFIEARVPIFDRRQTSFRTNQARIGKEKADLNAEAARQKLRFEVVRSFYGVVLGRSLVDIFDKAVAAAEANLKKTNDLVDVGMTTKADSLSADVELARTLQLRLEAESNLASARAEFNLIVEGKTETANEPAGELRETFFPVETREELIRIALENRPDYKQAELDIENSLLRSKSIRDEKLPEVSAFGNYGYSSPYITNGSADYTVGVSLSYTLFDAGRKARLTQAAEGETSAGLRMEMLANGIRLEVIRAHEKYITARAKIQVSIKTIAQSEEALRIVQDRYRNALATFDEVLRAEAALVRSRHDLEMSRYEYYVSYAAVLLATGRMTDVRTFE